MAVSHIYSQKYSYIFTYVYITNDEYTFIHDTFPKVLHRSITTCIYIFTSFFFKDIYLHMILTAWFIADNTLYTYNMFIIKNNIHS